MHHISVSMILVLVLLGSAIQARAQTDETTQPGDPAADPFAGAIPGKELRAYAPDELSGVARSHLLDQAYAVAAAYALPDGDYLNLDIRNTFHRSVMDTTLEDDASRRCTEWFEGDGYRGCITEYGGRVNFHVYLPDRLLVDLSAPSRDQVMAMKEGVDWAGLAALSAADGSTGSTGEK